jgi:hypothetical protein
MGGFYRLMAVLVREPWLAVVPGAAFVWLWARTGRRLALATAVAWLLYPPYECGMKWRVLCAGECSIRVDLLALYPGTGGAVGPRGRVGRADARPNNGGVPPAGPPGPSPARASIGRPTGAGRSTAARLRRGAHGTRSAPPARSRAAGPTEGVHP